MLSFSGLRASILLQLIFLIVAAMLLVNVAMVKFSERDLVQTKALTGRLLVQAVEQYMGYSFINQNKSFSEFHTDSRTRYDLNRLLESSEFSELVIVDQNGEMVFHIGFNKGKSANVSLAREAMANGARAVHYSGSTWGVIWLSYQDISLSAPIGREGRTLGGIVATASLHPIYDRLRQSEKVVLFYILLDTVILAIVGIYILSRTVIRPIHKLLAMTVEYKDGYVIPSFVEPSKNEIGNLSRSLSSMLKRLDENKKELRDHIASLERANTELKQAQDEIIRSEKFASVGRLSAGVAHEIGNPIGIVLGYLELIKKGKTSEEETRDFLDRVESEITRINVIIKQLLDFSRPSSGKPEKKHVHQLIKDAINMMRPQPMMGEIQIHLELEASKDEVFVDPNHLQQVFLNIILNAADALMDKNPSYRADYTKALTITSMDADPFVEVRFKDNGMGIPDEEISHVFDPFYTTKDPGKGTGLGLSVCYRIIESYGGTISIESRQGEGTTVIVKLPSDEHNHKGGEKA